MSYSKDNFGKEDNSDNYWKRLQEKGIAPDQFKEAWRADAFLYREILWALANKFTAEQQEKGDDDIFTEITHSEYIEEPNRNTVNSISICLTFGDRKGLLEEFRKYIESNIYMIPPALRKSLRVYVGFNYGDEPGFLIGENAFIPITYKEFMSSEGKPMGLDGPGELRAVDTLSQLTFEELQQLMTGKGDA